MLKLSAGEQHELALMADLFEQLPPSERKALERDVERIFAERRQHRGSVQLDAGDARSNTWTPAAPRTDPVPAALRSGVLGTDAIAQLVERHFGAPTEAGEAALEDGDGDGGADADVPASLRSAWVTDDMSRAVVKRWFGG